ncbi:MAG TPA: transglycosylase SLT domain-containing protein [Gemmatimonadaceae bacterium]|nr:transglycosylase SLT domain-containing protein [Gemmatimonadaceae bacterium]
MRNLRGTYVHRGDRERRRRKMRALLLLTGFAASVGFVVNDAGPTEAKAEAPRFPVVLGSEAVRLRAELDAVRGELDLANAQLERWHKVFGFSSTYKVSADLATSIYDIAVAEGIEPDLAFRLVRLESQFNERATSPVGAIGLTQLMLPTARYFQKGITREALYDRNTNLRIGFRYLRSLIRENKGNVQLALLVYNRGPVAVKNSRQQGRDPSNGYDRIIMKGYKGSGVID